MRRPRQVAPYHLRLDWLMWFLPFSARVAGSEVRVGRHEPWFLALLVKLLEGDRAALGLLARGGNPFPDAPPRLVRASYYRYRFATPAERRETGVYWVRTRLGDYLPPVRLDGRGGLRPA